PTAHTHKHTHMHCLFPPPQNPCRTKHVPCHINECSAGRLPLALRDQSACTHTHTHPHTHTHTHTDTHTHTLTHTHTHTQTTAKGGPGGDYFVSELCTVL